MFPSFNKEKSNYLASWKNVFKGKVNLEGEKVYIKKKYRCCQHSLGVSVPLQFWLCWLLSFRNRESISLLRCRWLDLPSQQRRAGVEDCAFLPPWLRSAGYVKAGSARNACGHAVRVWSVCGCAWRIWGAGMVSLCCKVSAAVYMLQYRCAYVGYFCGEACTKLSKILAIKLSSCLSNSSTSTCCCIYQFPGQFCLTFS